MWPHLVIPFCLFAWNYRELANTLLTLFAIGPARLYTFSEIPAIRTLKASRTRTCLVEFRGHWNSRSYSQPWVLRLSISTVQFSVMRVVSLDNQPSLCWFMRLISTSTEIKKKKYNRERERLIINYVLSTYLCRYSKQSSCNPRHIYIDSFQSYFDRHFHTSHRSIDMDLKSHYCHCSISCTR